MISFINCFSFSFLQKFNSDTFMLGAISFFIILIAFLPVEILATVPLCFCGKLCENCRVIMCINVQQLFIPSFLYAFIFSSISPFASLIDATLSSNCPGSLYYHRRPSCMLFILKASSTSLHCCSIQFSLQFASGFSIELVKLFLVCSVSLLFCNCFFSSPQVLTLHLISTGLEASCELFRLCFWLLFAFL